MIPMSADTTLEVPDPGGSGSFRFRYILDKHQPEFLRLHRELAKRREVFSKEAAAEAREQTKGSKVSAPALRALTDSIASGKFIGALQDSPNDFLEFIDAWINLFVVGWSYEVVIPDGRPSACLGIADKLTMFSLVLSKMPELSTLGVDEVKKS